ncbi:unnamed protein product [Staurois parvus]|uniref:Transposase Tc1-like domain-containing protein n=1 Tax=Staurois parvus TaxID=386267 RepID=A0ABN9CBK4_9NEOB|nr:unnamed protein product [Staurois parvus]
MTERGQRMLKRTVSRRCQLSAESIAKDLQTSCGLQISTTTVHRELHGMGLTSPSWMQWCKARHNWTLEQWRRVLWSDESHFSRTVLA